MERFKEFIDKFTPYLEEIRKRVYTIAIIFLTFFVIGFLCTRYILTYILSFFDIEGVVIATTSPFQFADLSINIGLLTACLVTCPIFLYAIFSFLRSALSARERKWFFLVLPVSLLLFVMGFSYGFFIMYYALLLLAEINLKIGIQNIWDVGMFLTQIILTSALLGVLFQFPIVVSGIIRTGVIDVAFLRRKRRIAIFLAFIFATLLPPTDGVSLIAMALPLLLLYEVTIFVNSRERRAEIIHFK